MARSPTRIPPVLLLHVGWARKYDGDPCDPVQGQFGYIKEGNEDMGDALNFKPYRKICYGYAPVRTIDMARIGAPDADSIDDALVVWTATNPDGSGRYVVGWYRNATVYSSWRQLRPGKERQDIIAKAAAKDCKLLPEDERTFSIPCMKTGWPGIWSAFYAGDMLSAARLGKIMSYVRGEPSNGFLSQVEKRTGRKGAGWPDKPDTERNERVEKAAEAVVAAHYRSLGWKIRPVQDDWLGWDLTMMRGNRELHVEVKGRSEQGPVQLSANEYRAMCDAVQRTRYRLAIVHHALSSPRLIIFRYQPGSETWVSDEGDVLALTPSAMSARF